MGGGSWLYFLFYTMLNYWEFGQILLTGGAVCHNLLNDINYLINRGAVILSCHYVIRGGNDWSRRIIDTFGKPSYQDFKCQTIVWLWEFFRV